MSYVHKVLNAPSNLPQSSDELSCTTPLPALITKMLSASGTGMKTLILDAATTQSVSVVLSQTNALSNEIYLVQRIDDDKAQDTGTSQTKHADGARYATPHAKHH